MNQKQKNVTIFNDLLSYRLAAKGSWLIKASVFREQQIMIVGIDRQTSEIFTKFFKSYSDVILFLDYLEQRPQKLKKLDFPEI
jgi:N-glycosylase/DNA lyase